MALALARRSELTVHVFHDERSAAFAALGISLASSVPAALLCTSGTAATHFHAAVVEAHLSGVPLLVLTADRPPELHGVGAPQTIDQQGLYTSAARFADAGVADLGDIASWRTWAAGWWPSLGPVHVNLPFREPLLGAAQSLPGVDDHAPGPPLGSSGVRPAPDGLDSERGLIVAGRGVDDPQRVADLATTAGWPILADPRSKCRGLPMSIAAFDSLLRDARFADDHRPDFVVHLGEPPASKVLGEWLRSSGARQVQMLDRNAVIDPLRLMTTTVVGPIGETCQQWSRGMRGAVDTSWRESWERAEHVAQAAIEAAFAAADTSLSEPAVARVVSGRPGPLVVSSSMPIRDVEWFGDPTGAATVFANRGANGIDGVVATAIGVALAAGRPTTVLLGDVALCHDASSLTAIARRDIELKIVVIDNDGGGIFSFLPQAAHLAAAEFERLFGTPHGADLVALAAAHGITAHTATTSGALGAALDEPGTALIHVSGERAANVADHQRLHAAVAAALAG